MLDLEGDDIGIVVVVEDTIIKLQQLVIRLEDDRNVRSDDLGKFSRNDKRSNGRDIRFPIIILRKYFFAEGVAVSESFSFISF